MNNANKSHNSKQNKGEHMATAAKVKSVNGKITQIVGVVVDVSFHEDHLPAIFNALEVKRWQNISI